METSERTHPAERVMDEIKKELKHYDEAFQEQKELHVIKNIRAKIKLLVEQLNGYFSQQRIDA